jgi:aspartate ammonia-lyase
MKVNEVIANLALDSLGHKKGEYQYVNSNDHASFGGPRTMSIRWPSTSG